MPDVIVIGAGITGLSAGYHLVNSGIKNTLVIGETIGGLMDSTPAIALGGFGDNITRFHHAYGSEIARQVWQFSLDSFHYIREFCGAENIYFNRMPRYRFSVSESETEESRQAVTILNDLGFNATFRPLGRTSSDFEELSDRVEAVQCESNVAAHLDVASLKSLLQFKLQGKLRQARVKAIKTTPQGIEVQTDSEKWTCEMVVLACHDRLPMFANFLEPVIIPYADQWAEYYVTGLKERRFFFSAHHGYEWGALMGSSLIIGGGRFLRQHAGIGATAALLSEKVQSYLQRQLHKTFNCIDGLRLIRQESVLGIRPCDELPIIGPMFGNERLLISSGYMGFGLAIGFHAGRVIADFVKYGRCDSIAPILLPQRLRTLGSA